MTRRERELCKYWRVGSFDAYSTDHLMKPCLGLRLENVQSDHRADPGGANHRVEVDIFLYLRATLSSAPSPLYNKKKEQ